ncbi:MAG: hypothetical protein H6538_00870 [Bacteroidales bacterium]|nr:hypothetical protein [Bacteroidales bacterium]MCB8999955.1 hypothetical protein [Bacteroidales bacterium]MCB9012594.1 hypothetical protein [Bacteroidales bacterium]
MIKSEAVIFLINSMSKPEKKAFTIASTGSEANPDYLEMYQIIVKDRNIRPETLRKKFEDKVPGSSYDTAVKYLHKRILDIMLDLREEQDGYYSLYNKILKARILFEKSLFKECFNLLQQVIKKARELENYNALLFASKLELEYLLILNLPDIDEKTLLNKQFSINETLRFIQKVNQQSSLYELLKHRITYKGNVRSEMQKTELNDLVVSEMSIVASSNLENFEIKKLHQLFQANYLISVGDHKSALQSYYELNLLFETNKQLWTDPPIYYLLTLEGVLESLRGIRNYEGMVYFTDQLKKIKSPSSSFNANVSCLNFLYELIPLLDNGDFASCETLIEKQQKTLFAKTNLLSLPRQAELNLYSALVYIGLRKFHQARTFLNQIILIGKNFYNLPLYRTIRLVNLMLLYEMNEMSLIKSETRSIRRDMHDIEKGYRIERIMLNFVNKSDIPVYMEKRELYWDRLSPELNEIKNDVFEHQVLKIFDFPAWIESKILKIPLSEILQNKSF